MGEGGRGWGSVREGVGDGGGKERRVKRRITGERWRAGQTTGGRFSEEERASERSSNRASKQAASDVKTVDKTPH